MDDDVLLITAKPWFNNSFPPILILIQPGDKHTSGTGFYYYDLDLSGIKSLHDSEASLQASCRTLAYLGSHIEPSFLNNNKTKLTFKRVSNST